MTSNFVFDTCATITILDSTVASKFSIKPFKEQTGIGASGSSTFQMVKLKIFQVGSLKLKKRTTVLVNLCHNKTDVKIDGIVGCDILSTYIVQID